MQQVVVQLFNGLGNQLFQYAAGRLLAWRHGVPLRLVHHDPEGSQPGRPLLLQQFSIGTSVERMGALDRLVVSTRPRYRIPGRLIRSARRIELFLQDPDRIAEAVNFNIRPHTRSVYLSGYFQEYGFVRPVEGYLRRELTLREPLSPRAQHFAERIRAARRPVSVHLRRGDYLATFGPNGVLPMSYYERAIARMRETFGDASFFVFSDDLPYAEFWARSDARMTVVDVNDPDQAHETMHLMSLCRHHIIANSTFSWWGAWLNSNADKQVIAPDRWLGVPTSQALVACPEWRLLPSAANVPEAQTTVWPRLAAQG